MCAGQQQPFCTLFVAYFANLRRIASQIPRNRKRARIAPPEVAGTALAVSIAVHSAYLTMWRNAYAFS
jgi:hypothetical protein